MKIKTYFDDGKYVEFYDPIAHNTFRILLREFAPADVLEDPSNTLFDKLNIKSSKWIQNFAYPVFDAQCKWHRFMKSSDFSEFIRILKEYEKHALPSRSEILDEINSLLKNINREYDRVSELYKMLEKI